MEFKVLILLLLLIPGLFLCASPGFWNDQPADKLIETLLKEMSDEELLGQVFMLGYIGKKPSAEILKWIRKGIGGIKIFSRNVNTLDSITRDIGEMQTLSSGNRLKIPLLIATDQEGGWVRHIKKETSITPGNIALGASDLPRDAFLTGYYIGEELKALGINMNFAPTIDIYSNPQANVIGPRAFSSDSISTAILALAYMKGMAKSGIISTAKHYPGHGHADKDSHGALPVVRISFDEIWERELVPYRILIREGLPAIMSGHLAYPEILGNLIPASRSSYFIKDILREKLGFHGILVTDDMEMNGAISGGLNTSTASLEALKAGNDMILISHTPRIQEKTWLELLEYLKKDTEFRAEIENSVRRILKLKLNTFTGHNSFPLSAEEEKSADRIAQDTAEDFFAESSMRSVTLIMDKDIPFSPGSDEKVLLVGQFEDFFSEGKLRYPLADTFYYPYSPFYYARDDYMWSIPIKASSYDTIIFCLANYNSLEILKTLKDSEKKIIVVSVLTPVYLREVPWVESSLAIYGTSRECFKAGFAVLNGDFDPEGILPVDFLNLDSGTSQ